MGGIILEEGNQLECFTQILEALQMLQEDRAVPRNVRNRLEKASNSLCCSDEHKIKISKAMEELDDIIDDPNMQPYTRTQIWNIVSMLEQV